MRVLQATATFLVVFTVSVSALILPVGGNAFVRGDAHVCERLDEAEAEIRRYLVSSATAAGTFHVQGWRWHTMSLVRESRRLHRLAVRLRDVGNTENWASLETTADYTVGFNMKGLHRIEKDLFFPWLRIKNKSVPERVVAQAFGKLLDQLERDRQRIETLGTSLVRIINHISQRI